MDTLEFTFINESIWLVEHNLGYRPIFQVFVLIDDGSEIEVLSRDELIIGEETSKLEIIHGTQESGRVIILK